MEYKIKIPTVNGKGVITKQIEGEIDCMIINMPFLGSIEIVSELGYVIYQNKQIMGVEYIPIRVQTQDRMGHRINFSNDKYKLKEKVIISIQLYRYNREANEVVGLILRT